MRTCPAPTGDTRRMFLPVCRSGQLVPPKGNVEGKHDGAAEERKGWGRWRKVKSSEGKERRGKEREETVTGRVVTGVSKEEEEVATRRLIGRMHRW